MPRYLDVDDLDIFIEEISVSGLPILPSWITFTSNGDGSGLKMVFSPDLDDYVGEYTIDILITDSDSEKSYTQETLSGSFTLSVIGDDGKVKVDNSFVFEWPTTSEEPPKPIIRDISATGLVWIEWE